MILSHRHHQTSLPVVHGSIMRYLSKRQRKCEVNWSPRRQLPSPDRVPQLNLPRYWDPLKLTSLSSFTSSLYGLWISSLLLFLSSFSLVRLPTTISSTSPAIIHQTSAPPLLAFSPSRLLPSYPSSLLPSCPPALLPFYPSRPQVSRLENRATQRTISQPHFHSQNLWGGWSWERAWREKIIRYKFTSQHRHRYRHLSHLSSLPIEEESQGQKLIRLIRKRKS